MIAFTVFVSASGVASAVPNTPLFFGSPENLSALNIAKVTGTAPSGEYGVKTIRYEIDAAECSIHTVPDAQGYVYLKIADLKPCTKPGEPQLPMKTFVIKLPKNAEVIGVEIVQGSYREIENELNIVPMPQPVPIILPEEKAGKPIADTKIYSHETYFPGKAISYYAGSDGKHKIVFLRIFPVQYIPAEKKATLITDAKVSVYYSYKEREEGESLFHAATFEVSQEDILNAKNLIITPPELFEHAKELESFHDYRGTSTEVVNTTWIYSNYVNASDPPFEGYKNSSIGGWNNITGYNYSLAKRTIAFLKDHSAHPNLKYVTLFGNARLVPPSYYIYINHWPDTYNNWIPTDFFYASPDYDFVSNYMVGRIPVNNSEEAEHVVQKIKDWNVNLSYDWFKNVALIGGTIGWYFGSRCYSGELTTVDSVNLGYFEGMNVTKLYLSNSDYTPEKVQTAYKSDYGFIYHYSHGSGNAMVKADPHEGLVDTINTTILENLPANTNVPIVVSGACMNGAFDTNLYPNTMYGYAQPISFGEGVLLSNAAGIAYIGGSRVNHIWPDVYLDRGYLHVIKELWMAGMLTYLFEAYHNGSNTLGNMTKTAMETYIEENGFNSILDNATIFEFTLLGDPALELPAQQPSISYQQPFSTALNPDRYTDDDQPVYNTSTNITINSTTDSPEVFTKRIDTFTFTTVEKMENATTGNSSEYTFSSTNETQYLVRTETEDGKEGWLYLTVANLWNKTGMVLVVDDDGNIVSDYERYYEDALAANGYTYNTWDVVLRGSPDNLTLEQYEAVVWLTGCFYNPMLTVKKNQEDLATYLDSGGKFFVSGQDIGHHLVVRGMGEEFYHNYLHADFVNYTRSIRMLEGIAGDPIGDGLAINISGGDGADNQVAPEEIVPYDENASMVFNYTEDGCGAIKANTTTYKVVYFAFGFEAINNSADRNTVMSRVISWLSPNWSFDTGAGTYPSVFGAHNGTITPSHDVFADKMYTYPCSGTGGHSEYVRIWGNGIDANASWNGYTGDWHNISFSESFTLVKGETYNYTIRTGSYPQIIHKSEHTTLDGSTINCTKFIGANGKEYDDWIPAIKLFL